MPKKKISTDVVDQWPGILDEVDIKVVPIQYMKAVEISFSDGKTWIMDIDHKEDENDVAVELEESLSELLDEYQDSILGINFVVDIPKVKKDITKRTRSFLKKRK